MSLCLYVPMFLCLFVSVSGHVLPRSALPLSLRHGVIIPVAMPKVVMSMVMAIAIAMTIAVVIDMELWL